MKNCSTGFSPFQVVYNKSPNQIVDLAQLPTTFIGKAQRLAEHIQQVHYQVISHLQVVANDNYKQAADKHHRLKIYCIGDLVMVHL